MRRSIHGRGCPDEIHMSKSSCISKVLGESCVNYGNCTLREISLDLDGVLVHRDCLARLESTLIIQSIRLIGLLGGHGVGGEQDGWGSARRWVA